jgi:hypothetical protein
MGYGEEMYEKETFHLYTRVINRLSTWLFFISVILKRSTIFYTERSKNNIRILHKMDIIKQKIITVFFIVLSIGFILAIGYFITGKVPEAFDVNNTTVPISLINGEVPHGYYAIDSTTMAKLPYGTTLGPVPTNGIIPYGYYIVTVSNSNGSGTTRQLAQVPNGYAANDTNTDVYPVTNTAKYESSTNGNSITQSLFGGLPNQDPTSTYNSDNLDVQYHDSETDIVSQDPLNSYEFNNITVADQNGVMQSVPYAPSQTLPIYYSPGSFVFGATSYVPNYEDSVYLSRTTGLSTVGQSYTTTTMSGGFCNAMTNNSLSIEQKCQSLPADVCPSTSCCVLLGGSKCVAGDGNGPTMKANYTDPSIINKDVYYYQGKCYGNCI